MNRPPFFSPAAPPAGVVWFVPFVPRRSCVCGPPLARWSCCRLRCGDGPAAGETEHTRKHFILFMQMHIIYDCFSYYTYCSGIRFLALPQGYVRGNSGGFRHGWFSPRTHNTDRINYTWHQTERERERVNGRSGLWVCVQMWWCLVPLVTLVGSFSTVCSDLSSPLLSSTSATVVSSGSLLYSR